MIDYTKIESTLNLLSLEYDKALCDENQQMPILFSKLAILELCGWIEVSVDKVLCDYVDNNVTKEENRKFIKKTIDRNYGFKFDTHLQPLFCSVFGIKNCETIFGSLSEQEMASMKTTLGVCAEKRNIAAHKYTEVGITLTYSAPSEVKSYYQQLKPAFEKIEKAIQNLGDVSEM